MKGANAVLACLIEQGVDTIFGYPGGMNLPLYDALLDEPRIRHILTTHEQNAAHAADGYARASGKVGVCIATSGPGATNLVTGIATAFMDSIPLVVITGQVDRQLIGSDAFQEIDILDITIPVTKYNSKVKKPEQLIAAIRAAFHIAMEGRPGPVLIDIPRDIFLQDIEFIPKQHEQTMSDKRPDAHFLSCIAEAVTLIQQAQRPIVIAGGGIISANASEEFFRFIETFKLPVVSTLMGLGSYPPDNEKFLGFSGLHGCKTANRAVAAADLIIAVGSRFGDRQTGSVSKYVIDTRFIHIDIDPAEIDKNISSSIGLAGDMKTILRLLIQHAKGPIHEPWRICPHAETNGIAGYRIPPFTVPWIMHSIAQAVAGRDIAFAVDVGQHQMWAAQYLNICSPRTWFTSGGLGTMGFALPAAMGAQLAFGSTRRLIHLAGDGGIKMTGNEYDTIARLRLPIISVIINNHCLGMIRQLQKVNYKERYMACQLSPQMDFTAYAGCFGIVADEVSTPHAFTAAFAQALASEEPHVIVAEVQQDWVDPMVKPNGYIDEFVDFNI